MCNIIINVMMQVYFKSFCLLCVANMCSQTCFPQISRVDKKTDRWPYDLTAQIYLPFFQINSVYVNIFLSRHTLKAAGFVWLCGLCLFFCFGDALVTQKPEDWLVCLDCAHLWAHSLWQEAL